MNSELAAELSPRLSPVLVAAERLWMVRENQEQMPLPPLPQDQHFSQ